MESWKINYQNPQLANNYLSSYIHYTNSEITLQEIKFIESILSINPTTKIVDFCCADGRHLREFQNLGYKDLTGIDLSQYMLDMLDSKQQEINPIKTIQGDIRDVKNQNADVVLNLFSSFGFFEDHNDNILALKNMINSVNKGGDFVIDFTPRELYERNLKNQEWYDYDNEIILKSQELSEKRYFRKTVQYNKSTFEKIERFSSSETFSVNEMINILKSFGIDELQLFDGLKNKAFNVETSNNLAIFGKKN